MADAENLTGDPLIWAIMHDNGSEEAEVEAKTLISSQVHDTPPG